MTGAPKLRKHAVVKIADASGTGGANVFTIQLENVVVNETWRKPGVVKDIEGALTSAIVVEGPDQPCEISIEGEYVRDQGVAGTPPTYSLLECVLGTGQAAGWTSDLDNGDKNGFILEVTYTDPGDSDTEVDTWTRCWVDEGSKVMGTGEEFTRFTLTCRSLDTIATVT